MKWKLNADTELDEYTITCQVNHETLADFVDILEKEINQWDAVEVTIPIRRLVCIPTKRR